MGGLSKSQGLNFVLLVIDMLIKYVYLLSLCYSFIAKEVADMFAEDVVKLHDYSTSIVLDCNKIFLSQVWSKLFRTMDTKLQYSSTYHP